MQIGIIGTGSIGKTLALKLSGAGHDVIVANSRGPESIDSSIKAWGAEAGTVAQAVEHADVVITSTPPAALPTLAPFIIELPKEVVVIDTSNYYPGRDEPIQAIEDGQVESAWTAQQLGRSVVKAWNAIYTESLEHNGRPYGADGRIAVPISADTEKEWKVAAQLMENTGFDPVWAGSIANSWRQQPGTPVYCIDGDCKTVRKALANAVKEEAPIRRDASFKCVKEFVDEHRRMPNAAELTAINRSLL